MSENKKDLSIFDLEQRLEEQVKTMDEDYSINELNDESEIDDRRQEVLSEIIDGLIPIYNYDLLSVAQSDLWIACEDTEQGSTNALDCIREAISRHLYDKAQEIIK